MADEAHAAGSGEHAGDQAHEHPNYVRVWALLLALLCISVIGPMFQIKAVTLVTAFGVAGYKAYLVAKNFMHIHVERPFVTYLMVTCLVFMLLFFAGTAPDVMKSEGARWEKPAWKAAAAAHAAAAQEAAGHAAH